MNYIIRYRKEDTEFDHRVQINSEKYAFIVLLTNLTHITKA